MSVARSTRSLAGFRCRSLVVFVGIGCVVGSAPYAEVAWQEGGERRVAIVAVGPVGTIPENFFLARSGGFGLRDLIEGTSAGEVTAALQGYRAGAAHIRSDNGREFTA